MADSSRTETERRAPQELSLRQVAEIGAARRSLTMLEKALLCAVLGLLLAAAILGYAMHSLAGTVGSLAGTVHDVRTEQQDGVVRGLKNRAVACAALEERAATVAACVEPDVLKYYGQP